VYLTGDKDLAHFLKNAVGHQYAQPERKVVARIKRHHRVRSGKFSRDGGVKLFRKHRRRNASNQAKVFPSAV
jgi:hypothetical protein